MENTNRPKIQVSFGSNQPPQIINKAPMTRAGAVASIVSTVGGVAVFGMLCYTIYKLCHFEPLYPDRKPRHYSGRYHWCDDSDSEKSSDVEE